MMNNFTTSQRLMTLQGVYYSAAGVDILDSSKFTSPIQYDSFDNWLGDDFQFLLDNIIDDFFDDIEENLLSVWSTNKSEQESADASALRSAMASALGMSDDGMGAAGDSGMTQSDLSDSEGVLSSDSSAMSSVSLDHDLSDHSGHKHKFHHPLESRYSGTESENLHGDTQGSHSQGTSDTDGDSISVSTQSIEIVQYEDFFADANANASLTITGETGMAEGVTWVGDADKEVIFGTMWDDMLDGDMEDDYLYGFEGDDVIEGGAGNDRLFGDAGNDTMFLGDAIANLTEVPELNNAGQYGEIVVWASGPSSDLPTNVNDFASGGSGDDLIIGHYGGNSIFGGPGHDQIVGFTAVVGTNQLYGGDGDDIIAHLGGSGELFGGAGDDIMDGGILVSATGVDMDGGAGDDYMLGNLIADDDMFGGDGNDYLNGRGGSDEIDGGAGDDILKAGTFAGQVGTDVLRGGEGNDTLYGGFTALEKTYGYGEFKYLYGDEGDDILHGSFFPANEFMWGGSGDDTIYGGRGSGTSILNGNEGDDIIFPTSSTYGGSAADQVVNGGKGDDLINPWELTYDAMGDLEQTPGNVLAYGANSRGGYGQTLRGGEGNDKIWGPYVTFGETIIEGGNGDDSLYGGYGTTGYGTQILGQGGKDLIRHDVWKGATGFFPDYGDIEIWGDWAYGSEADPTDTATQYGDTRLEKKLWGDDDQIYIGDGQMTGYGQTVFAGDGDDYVDFGDSWVKTYGYGGSGNDTFNLPIMGTFMTVRGGDGDDVFDTDRDQVVTSQVTFPFLYGDAGNDKMTLLQWTPKAYGYGGTGDDKIIYYDNPNVLVAGNDGDDIIYGQNNGDPPTGTFQKIYGDELATDITADISLAAIGGNDKIYGAEGLVGMNLQFAGGAGDDLIALGGQNTGVATVFGDHQALGTALTEDDTMLNIADGDDIISIANDNLGTVKAYGQGGNDKIVGGRQTMAGPPQVEFLYGGSGDDKIWLVSPGEVALDTYGGGKAYGGIGNDNLYGTDGVDTLVGDEALTTAGVISDTDIRGGDDTIRGYAGDDVIQGGFGNDLLDGGDGADLVYGQFGDDTLYGGAGDDSIYGDDMTTKSYGLMFGDDIIFAGEGADFVYGGQGDDKIYGEDGVDTIYGNAGEDIIYGGAGADILDSGYGWDTIFGGDGCDTIVARDGGDVIWLGDCEDGAAVGDQKVSIYGTGDDPENFTVIMDFWLESAKPWNQICINPDAMQANPTAGACTNGVDNTAFCIGAAQLADPDLLADTLAGGEGGIRGAGCKHDGGPLWVSIPLVDDPVVAAAGTGTYPQHVWARFFQRAQSKPTVSRNAPKITSYNNPERYEYSSRYESAGRDFYAQANAALLPRLAHNSYTQVSDNDELVECLRVIVCTSTT